jgi:excisionase family DNA binding protein
MLTVSEAARRARRNPETVRRWIREGKLTAWKVGTQHVIDEDDLTNTLAGGGPPRKGEPGIIADPRDRTIVASIHRDRAERMHEIWEAVAPYVARGEAIVSPRDKRNWLPSLVGRIVHAVDPVRIVEFGSRARGDARQDSDYDLLVILDNVDDRRATKMKIRDSYSDLPVASDVLVASIDEVDGRVPGRPTGATFWALHEGRTIYDRDRA